MILHLDQNPDSRPSTLICPPRPSQPPSATPSLSGLRAISIPTQHPPSLLLHLSLAVRPRLHGDTQSVVRVQGTSTLPKPLYLAVCNHHIRRADHVEDTPSLRQEQQPSESGTLSPREGQASVLHLIKRSASETAPRKTSPAALIPDYDVNPSCLSDNLSERESHAAPRAINTNGSHTNADPPLRTLSVGKAARIQFRRFLHGRSSDEKRVPLLRHSGFGLRERLGLSEVPLHK